MKTKIARATKTGLLVSVQSVEEAQAALAGGVDILDVKDPSKGSLGMAHHETVAAILKTVRGAVPVSAALGEWSTTAMTEACWHLELPLQYVKWGLAGYGHQPGFGEELLDLRRQVPSTTEVVLTCYVDYEDANSPPPLELVKFAKRYRYAVFLFDTAIKDGRNLLDYTPLPELQEMVDSLKRSGVKVALGGSLKLDQAKSLRGLGADWLAVRGAVCVATDRTAEIDPIRVKKWKSALVG
jgi:(5-formylfuran-3-yl)methyl phosphate synthase